MFGPITVPRVAPKVPLAPFQGCICPVTYWRGDRAEFVAPVPGMAEYFHYRLVEGHRKGETVILSRDNAIYGEGPNPFADLVSR